MFGSNQQGVNQYASVSLETGVVAASPGKLIVMLYDGAISACLTAIKHMHHQDIEAKGNMISKAIMIIESGLRSSLDKKAGGEIAESLDALYRYLSDRLYMANLKNKPELILEVVKLLRELREAWDEVSRSQPVGTGDAMNGSRTNATSQYFPAKA